MGFLDFFNPNNKFLNARQARDAQTQGWLGAASALANMSAPHPGPSPSILQLLTAGLGGYQSGMGNYMHELAAYYKPLTDMKQQEEMTSFLQSNPEFSKSLGLPEGMPVAPSTAIELASKKAAKVGDYAVDLQFKPQLEANIEAAKNPVLIARTTGEEAAKLPFAMQKTKYEKGLDLSNQFAFDRGRLREVAPGATLVGPGSVEGGLETFYKSPNPAPGTQEGQIDKWYAERYTEIQDAAIRGRDKLQKMKAIDSSLGDIQTGKFGNTALDIKKGLARVGIQVDLPDEMGAQEVTQALARGMALEARNPSGGAGMPGAMSDADRVYLDSMQPGLEMTPEGRRQLIKVTEKLQKRNEDVATLARNYRLKTGGKLDDNFLYELKQYSETHPLFQEEAENKRLDEVRPKPTVEWVIDPRTNRLKKK